MPTPPQTPYERTPKAVGHRLRVLRKALEDMQAKDMSGAINVAPNTWSQWEKGRSLPDVLSMTRLWEKFGADLNYIYLGRTDTLAFDLAMKIRTILASGVVPEDAASDEVGRQRSKRGTKKEPANKADEASA